MKKILLFLLLTLSIELLLANDNHTIHDGNHIENTNNYYMPPTSQTKNILMSFIIPILGSAASIISILVVWYNVKTQIKASEKNILKQYYLQNTNLLIENISNLLLELSKPDDGNIIRKKYVSNDHFLLEKKIALLLDSSSQIEVELITCLRKFSTEQISDKSSWLEEIENKSQKVITTKMLKNESN